jgi:hypothetical protein
MATLNITFQAVSIPTNSGGISVTISEDVSGDGTADNTATISLSDGVTSYSVSGFDGTGSFALDVSLGPPSDEEVTASVTAPIDVQA